MATDIQILFTNYDIITYFLNLASCSEHFISIKHWILATFNINKKNSILTACMPLRKRWFPFMTYYFSHPTTFLASVFSFYSLLAKALNQMEPNFLGMIFEKNKFEICLNGVDPAWGGESRGLKMGSFSLKKIIFYSTAKILQM